MLKKKEKMNDAKTNNSTKLETSELSKNKEDCLTIKKKYVEVKNTLQRLQAEFINFRKRTEEEKSKFASFASEQLIKKILPVIDNFELALNTNIEDTSRERNEFSKGIELIYAQLQEILEEEGLKKLNSTGKFDPKIHEAILVEESDDSDNEIKEVLQDGYKLGDKIIRHSKVKITKKIEENSTKTNLEANKNE